MQTIPFIICVSLREPLTNRLYLLLSPESLTKLVNVELDEVTVKCHIQAIILTGVWLFVINTEDHFLNTK